MKEYSPYYAAAIVATGLPDGTTVATIAVGHDRCIQKSILPYFLWTFYRACFGRLLIAGIFLMNAGVIFGQLADTTGSNNRSFSISGYIYDTHTAHNPVPGVRINTSSGVSAIADQTGFYRIALMKADTIHFYNQEGVLVATYPAVYMQFYQSFNVYLKEPEFLLGTGDQGHDLGTVKVTGRNYEQDSLMRRYLYKDIFEYKRPQLKDAIVISKIGKVPVPLAIGISIPGLIRWLQVRKNDKDDRMKAFAFYSEEEGYIKHRLSAANIELFTGIIDEDSIQYLRLFYRPTATQLRDMNDLEMGEFLIAKAHAFRSGALPGGAPAFTEFKKGWNILSGDLTNDSLQNRVNIETTADSLLNGRPKDSASGSTLHQRPIR